jgi:hypothetical protein
VKWNVQFEHPAQIELAEAFHHYNRLSFVWVVTSYAWLLPLKNV